MRGGWSSLTVPIAVRKGGKGRMCVTIQGCCYQRIYRATTTTTTTTVGSVRVQLYLVRSHLGYAPTPYWLSSSPLRLYQSYRSHFVVVGPDRRDVFVSRCRWRSPGGGGRERGGEEGGGEWVLGGVKGGVRGRGREG